jgi:hypothetical protein
MADEVLTRKKGLREGIMPTGRKLGVVPDRQMALHWVQYVDGKGGTLPYELQGSFTGRMKAQQALDEFLVKFWDISENASRKPKVTSNDTTNANG